MKHLKITSNRDQAADFISFILQLEGIFLDEVSKIENDILYINVTSYKAIDDFIKEIKEQEKFTQEKYRNLTIKYLGKKGYIYESI